MGGTKREEERMIRGKILILIEGIQNKNSQDIECKQDKIR